MTEKIRNRAPFRKTHPINVIIAILAACRDVRLWGVDLKGGMELGPWQACFERIATTPEEADELFRDAVAELNSRAASMAATGKRTWEPAPDNPALVIITDEHAELPEESHECADSVARRGRAVAVNVIAATQRPTQVLQLLFHFGCLSATRSVIEGERVP